VTLRAAKVALVFGVALFYTLVVFNNLTDYESNHEFVRHTLMMDTIFPGSTAMWRALNAPAAHTVFYISIIAWEAVTMALCWWGAARMARALRGTAAEFHGAKNVAIAALTVGMMLWLVAFLDMGGEWFLMWQSKNWNGQEAAFRMFAVVGIVLLLVARPEHEVAG
jgi:predicted small integral membrane protein